MAITVAAAAVLSGTAPAPAQIQLVPQGRQQPVSQQPQTQRQPPAYRPSNRPEGQPSDERPGRRRGQQRQPAAEAAPVDPNTPTPFPRRLDQRTIRARFFNGQPINARALGGGLFTLVFHEDGRMERTSPRGEVTTGRWRFIGDSYCSRWDPATPATPPAAPPPTQTRGRAGRQPVQQQRAAPETCHTVVQEGTTIKVVRNTRAVATWAHEGTPPPP